MTDTPHTPIPPLATPAPAAPPVLSEVRTPPADVGVQGRTPAPEPATDEPKKSGPSPTVYVVCFAISPNMEDQEVPPEVLSPVGEFTALGQDAAKKRAIAGDERLQKAAALGSLWLVAIPKSSFKLKRVIPRPPSAPTYTV